MRPYRLIFYFFKCYLDRVQYRVAHLQFSQPDGEFFRCIPHYGLIRERRLMELLLLVWLCL